MSDSNQIREKDRIKRDMPFVYWGVIPVLAVCSLFWYGHNETTSGTILLALA